MTAPPTLPPAALALLDKAMRVARGGNIAEARRILDTAMQQFPGNPVLANSAGNLAMKSNEPEVAQRLFAAASKAAPGSTEFAANNAIALQTVGRFDDAVDALGRLDGAVLKGDARLASIRASLERDRRDPAAAAKWYDRSLAIDPRYPKGLAGRARTALERAEPEAEARYDAALSASPKDPLLWLGKAQAMDAGGNATGARSVLEQVTAQLPSFVDGLTLLTQIRVGQEESDPCAPFVAAERSAPNDPRIPIAHIEALAGIGREGDAADVAASARARFPGEPDFVLLEAIHAGSDGQDDRSARLLSKVSENDPRRWVHEARHCLRTGEPDRADTLLVRCVEQQPDNIGAWALRGLAWRLLDDDRARWLHHQEGLIAFVPLDAEEVILKKARSVLERLHDTSTFPIGQSLRGGTQTRGLLFDRVEPELAALKQAILATIERYRAALPAVDFEHPLLRYRDMPFAMHGSWSVRLTGGADHHAAHIHPQGLVSSALYMTIPEVVQNEQSEEGWLELGRPPSDLRLALPPLARFAPREGYMALFPSTLYHSTTPFSVGTRMSVAFDLLAGTRP